ncbi:glucose-6-phosphate 1-dehydrogenase [Arthrobacter globiformis NBRC 12137]|uniref:Glucose-6-phosphate 1-dehydrogenase n=1 Tax=Arthrobacter globiformis (strain ATCC 8010 / DSM 20124 / JCM 1332 / NBRC 12137 / NCIMB 8907 / NRRL B-2979 / 168) TaxID=1077972 RepID=H0QTG4_ARTG1|nr:glucose-6-phosphate dehydrogenase [Arthrobacter globiformis]GAB16115.1 glucose-6-phosphate 1-dehydrogenase [Arthrobacter globiformis NBRC 12137]
MTSQTTVKTLLILGASGDLTGRLLLPGLARLVATGRATGLKLVGAGSDPWSGDQWRERVRTAFDAAAETADGAGKEALAATAKSTEYHQADVTADGPLAQLLADLEGPVAVYFALPPQVSQKACEILRPEQVPAGTRLVMEKPFGSGEESARELNKTLLTLVPEDHIHRVDHFLGKATVLNILGLRFANNFLEPVWNRDHIAKVEIIFEEDLALEGRARYYDGAGALRDMIQSHLLQIMALLAIEPPATIGERDLRDAIAAVLRASSIKPPYTESTRRARYLAGSLNGRDVPDYTAEEGVDPDRNTETLAEVHVGIANWRWKGVPFILRSGKALGAKRKEAVVTFRPVPHLPAGFTGRDTPNTLRIGFGPDTLELDVDVNGPGDIFSLDRAALVAELNASELLPYGEVLEGVLTGDPLLSVRGDTAEECWRIVEPVLAAWAAGKVPLGEYRAGSGGAAPKEA